MDILRYLLDFGYLYDTGGVDTVVYATMALAGTALFAVRLLLSLLFGLEGDLDLDSTDIEHGSGFGLFSLQSVLGFFMGAGWAGLAARLEWQQSPGVAALIAGGFGGFLMVLSSTLMFGAKKLTHEVTFELNDAVGKTGTAYLTIPAKGKGAGQLRISVSGRSMTVDAISESEPIEAFESALVTEVRDDKVLVVKPTAG